jgi:hypothetical protein
MPRIQAPWYKSRLSWRHVPWVVGSAGGVWGSLYLIRSGSFVPGSLLLLVALVFLWGSSKTLWRNRQPFVFAVRGDRKVKFRGAGRDDTVFEENGRKVKIYIEFFVAGSSTGEIIGVGRWMFCLSVGKTSRAIYANSIRKYEPPHDVELLTDEQREQILDLLCEEYDYRGVRYEVIMNSKLSLQLPCPRCREDQEFEIELPFGCISERHYKIGDKIEWQANRLPEKGGRPGDGNLRKEVWSRCPTCGRDFWVIVSVREDTIEKVEVDSSRSVRIPDDSIAIVEDGKIVGYRIEPKKREAGARPGCHPLRASRNQACCGRTNVERRSCRDSSKSSGDQQIGRRKCRA